MLYLCATPIGNLGDITLRVIDALQNCDAVYCEDTRQTAKLLNHLEIKKPVVSCHKHNEQFRAEELIARLKNGENICYCSDAGMPAVSDPGEVLVRSCIEHELDFTVLPGASAVLSAAVLSGLPMQPFTFFGFMPRDNKAQAEMLETIRACSHLCLLYESPHRIKATLNLLHEALGNVRAAVLRELTKKFESAYRGTLKELIDMFTDEPKGECVIAVYPQRQALAPSDERLNLLLSELLKERSVKDAAAIASEVLELPKKLCYSRALILNQE
ncbi:MAG: 16S rRNA (cytidine(1402)-2'-O)-methyltransferase [Clostridia bacterium]|nr:16S rRNA (cytidine(1402)-2'-O)-methyltransferase [Clostridia bacterium]